MVLGKGHWNSFIKQKARSLDVDLPSGFNPEKYMYKAVGSKLNKAPVEKEEAAEWCLAYLFIPKAIESGAEDLFEKFERKRESTPERQHNFAGFFSSYVPNAIKQYQRFENKRLEDRWDEDDMDQLEHKVRDLENKYKHEVTTDPKTMQQIPFGLSGNDIEKLHSLTDLVEDITFKSLKKDLLKYIKDNDNTSNQFAHKILKLKYLDPDYSGKELADLLKTTPKTISTITNKNLKKLVAEYAAQLKKKYNDPTLYRTMLNLKLVPEGVTARRMAAIANYINKLCDNLEVMLT